MIDGTGGLITGLMLSQVLARLEPLFGMPQQVLLVLSGVAFCYAFYSFVCALLVSHTFRPYLKVIMFANLAYCLTTSVLIFWHLHTLTWLGIAYFVGEIIVILGLVMVEYRLTKRPLSSDHQ